MYNCLQGLRERPNAKRMLYEFLLNYLLLPYGSHPSIVAPPPAPPMPQLPGNIVTPGHELTTAGHICIFCVGMNLRKRY